MKNHCTLCYSIIFLPCFGFSCLFPLVSDINLKFCDELTSADPHWINPDKMMCSVHYGVESKFINDLQFNTRSDATFLQFINYVFSNYPFSLRYAKNIIYSPHWLHCGIAWHLNLLNCLYSKLSLNNWNANLFKYTETW